jgi:hypothetical protein
MDTVCEGKIPAWRNETGGFLLHATEREAQMEIADYSMIRIRQFQHGERDFDDALTVEDFIEPVTTRDDGTFSDLDGKSYGPWEILEASASLPQS